MLDLNSATVADLVEQLGVTVAEAYELRLWRPYLDWEEVEMVPGLDADRVAELRAAGARLVVPSYAAWQRPGLGPAT